MIIFWNLKCCLLDHCIVSMHFTLLPPFPQLAYLKGCLSLHTGLPATKKVVQWGLKPWGMPGYKAKDIRINIEDIRFVKPYLIMCVKSWLSFIV